MIANFSKILILISHLPPFTMNTSTSIPFSTSTSTSSSSPTPLRITVFGAGAVGGTIACRLGYAALHKQITAQVSIVVRGEHYRAIQRNNNCMVLRVPPIPSLPPSTMNNSVDPPLPTEYTIPFHTVTDNALSLGPQDIVIIGIKAHSWSKALNDIRSLISKDTIILCIQNGLPWYLYPRIACINNPDPSLPYESVIPISQIIGSVVYLASAVVQPGIIEQYTPTPKIIFGDILVTSSTPSSSSSSTATTALTPSSSSSYSSSMNTLLRILQGSNLSVTSTPTTTDSTPIPTPTIPYPLQIEPTLTIANHIWLKLWGNIAFNLISVLTLSTMGEMINNAEIYSLAYQIMEETQQVGTAIQPVPVHFPQTITERLKISASIPSNFKTSMYQDLLQQRTLEIEAIGGAVIALAKEYNIAIPRIETIVALVRLRNEHMHIPNV